jgi:hypothetical protein
MTSLNPGLGTERVNLQPGLKNMPSVIAFTPRPKEKGATSVAAHDADIIIFPGVRMERIEFDSDVFEPDEPNSPSSPNPINRNRAAKS